MNAGLDLFSYPKVFPDAPGYRNRDTSKAAAKSIMPKQGTIQAEVLRALHTHGPMTAREISVKIGRLYSSTQPRTAELSQSTPTRGALIKDTGQRRPDGESGKMVIVWGLV